LQTRANFYLGSPESAGPFEDSLWRLLHAHFAVFEQTRIAILGSRVADSLAKSFLSESQSIKGNKNLGAGLFKMAHLGGRSHQKPNPPLVLPIFLDTSDLRTSSASGVHMAG